jgi:hypothetical protein
MKLKIENPHKLVEMYNKMIPQWRLKFISSGYVYKFGLTTNKRKSKDEFEIDIDNQIKEIYDSETFEHRPYVDLIMKSLVGNTRIENQIPLEEFKNADTMVQHIIDGIEELMIEELTNDWEASWS